MFGLPKNLSDVTSSRRAGCGHRRGELLRVLRLGRIDRRGAEADVDERVGEHEDHRHERRHEADPEAGKLVSLERHGARQPLGRRQVADPERSAEQHAADQRAGDRGDEADEERMVDVGVVEQREEGRRGMRRREAVRHAERRRERQPDVDERQPVVSATVYTSGISTRNPAL